MKNDFYTVSYDISDPKRLRAVARIMEQFGKRVQKSVFECWLAERDLKALKEALLQVLKTPPDSVRFYPLCVDCRKKAMDSGNTDIMEIQAFYIV